MKEIQEIQFQSLGREDPLEEEMANPLQYSCLELPKDRGAWRMVTKSQTRLSTYTHTHTHTHTTGSSFFLLLSSSPSCESPKTCPSWPRTTTNRRLCSVGRRSPHPISSRLLPLRLPLCFALASLTSCPSARILPFTHWTRAFGWSGWAELSEIPFTNLLPGLWPKNFTVGLSFIQHSIRLYWESTWNRERWTGKQVRSHSLFKI